MPTYEYQCPEGHLFEKFQRITDKPRAKCPVCGRPAARKISGGAGLVFKGSGFYITDYGKDGKGPRKEAGEKPDKAEKSDAKPPAPADSATKPDTKSSKSAPSTGQGKKAAGE